MTAALLADLKARGLLNQVTADDELINHLETGSRTLYCGFDPTADSLHLGHLVPLLVLTRFQNAGHKPVALVGGATGLIGDPSFKAAERQLNTPDIVAGWADKIRNQVSQFIKFDGVENAAVVVNNLDWAGEMNVLDFLRDVGKHFSVNAMINKESVQQRLNREGAGISFTEFSYALLQGMDFAELNRRHNCTLQVGGSDQWGNIVNGIDLTRRVIDQQIFGLTSPLLTTSDGKKMGKSQDGAVWLNADMRSPYEFWQFWRNTTDADVGRFLKLYTELPLDECERLGALAGSDINDAKIVLANEVTTLCHGAEAAAAAEATAREVFEKGGVGDDLPTLELTADELGDGISIVQVLVKSGLAKSGKDAKRLIAENGAKIDDEPLTNAGLMLDAAALSSPVKLSAGKKRHALVKLS